MKTFKQFITERKADPVELASRVARRFGKRSYFGPWMQAVKHQNVPLTSYNRKEAESASRRLDRYHSKIGMFKKETRDAAVQKMDSDHKHREFHISELRATQPFNRVEDKGVLAGKVTNKNPTHIHVVTHKGKHYVADGHHAVMAAQLRGEKTVRVKHLNLDEVL